MPRSPACSRSVHDTYTVFLSKKEYADLNVELDRRFSGVGIVMRVNEQTKLLNVADVLEDGPAAKAGVKPGDVIVSVDGKSTKGLTNVQDSGLLRGPSGTVVRLHDRACRPRACRTSR